LKKEIKEALEEQNNRQHVHEQKKTVKSKRLRNTVTCQPATAWKDKARKNESSSLEKGRTEGETKRESNNPFECKP
jgi:hypothetical protein